MACSRFIHVVILGSLVKYLIMAQIFNITLNDYTRLVTAESSVLVSRGGSQNPGQQLQTFTQPRALSNTVTDLELTVPVAEIRTPRPPNLANLGIRALTINGRRYTSLLQWTPVWTEYFRANEPVYWLEFTQTGRARDRNRGEFQIGPEHVLIPQTGQTLAQAQAQQLLDSDFLEPIEIPPVSEPTLPEPEVPEPEQQPSVIAVDLNLEGQLVTTLSDSSQEIVGTVIETTLPLGSIISYYGNFAAIPAGWVLCDGTNDTPDLSADFIIDPDPDRQFFYIKKI